MLRILENSVLPLIIFSLFVTKAEALNYNTAYMVTADHSSTLSLDSHGEHSYASGQTPWVYLKLKLSDLNLNSPLHVLWSWSNYTDSSLNETKLQHFNLAGLPTDKEIWSVAPQPWWLTTGKPGKWTVDVAWLNSRGAMGTSTATFNVTPEPLSSALLFFGGLPLAAVLLRKKKAA